MLNRFQVFLLLACLVLGGGAGCVHQQRQQLAEVPAPGAVRFIVFGDSQFANQGVYERMVHEADMLRPDFVIQVGDMIQGYTDNREQIRREWKHFASQLEPLSVPFYPVPGNHDIVTPESQEIYAEYWGPERYFYSFDHGPVHGIVLSSYQGEEDNRIAPWQRDWMRADLEAWAAARGGRGSEELQNYSVFVFLHSPLWRYQEGTPGYQDWLAVQDILADYPVRLVIGGHTHEYVWQQERGIDYLVMNSSGGMPQYNERGGNFHSMLHVAVEPDGDVRFGSIKAGSVLPLDTVNSEERQQISDLYLPDGVLRLEGWQPGARLNETVRVPLVNETEEARVYRLDWRVPYQSGITVDPAGERWVEVAAGESAEVMYTLRAASVPLDPELAPTLQVEAQNEIRTGYVNRQWEEIYRQRAASNDPDVYQTKIPLEQTVTWEATYSLFSPPVAIAGPRTTPITIDGEFSEQTWNNAAPVTRFTHGDGEAPPVGTEVRFLYDAEFLYVAATMMEPYPENLKASAGGDIPLTWNDDDFELFFDPQEIRTDYYRLFQNAGGTRFNSRMRQDPDRYYESTYESAIQVKDDRWTLEMAIPWVEAGAETPPTAGTTWGLNIGRHRQQSAHPRFAWSGGGLYNPRVYGTLRFE